MRTIKAPLFRGKIVMVGVVRGCIFYRVRESSLKRPRFFILLIIFFPFLLIFFAFIAIIIIVMRINRGFSSRFCPYFNI